MTLRVFLAHTQPMFEGYYGERALAGLREHAEVVRNTTGAALVGRALADAAAGCQAIIADRATPGTAETFAHVPDLIAFHRCAVDISTIDVAAASAAGVLVTQATPGFVDAVAELGIGLIVDLVRGITDAAGAYRAGREPEGRMGLQLSHATLGIVGHGRIGQRLAAIARAMGMRVLINDPALAESVAFHALLAESDIAVCLAPALPQTENLFGAAAFAAMKRGAYFVNLARGQLVDDAALEAALEGRHLAGAALDVGRAMDQRPAARLACRHDVIATPHIAGLTREAAEHQAMDTVRQVAALAAGRMPEGAVNASDARRFLARQHGG
ncbi:NAD(P)-dependent oxidoreductase [Plastoroseomonas arctica]|uniref:Hydroxyacid dehydrogenase n=1 Tax=Plastoroseomonas arctica TaxID=1509237 RepID=A0AAF1K6D2_9PROT|nr:NAD(P)-dependent oxidoreductase [Plastoroseomonas arctica]MBR0657219.1 hydroxyacid dehydrogenase [Plastoroseomonas arctica]